MEILGSYLMLVFVFILIVIGFLQMYGKKQARNILIVIMILVVVISVVFLSFEDKNNKLYYDNLVSIEYEGVVALELEGNKLVHQNDGNEVVFNSYYNSQPSSTLKGYYPVYLREETDYYVLVISKDENKTFKYDRFLYMDYERSDEDKLYLIEKSTGFVFDTEEYELIGFEIDLTTIKFSNNIENGDRYFISSVFIPNEKAISYYRFYRIKEEYNIDSSKNMYSNYQSMILTVRDAEYRDSIFDDMTDEVVYFDMVNIYFGLIDVYGKYEYGYIWEDETGKVFHDFEYLQNFEHVRDGYIRIKADGIYYLNDDEEYRVINRVDGDKLIARNVDDEEFNTRVEKE